MFSLVITTMITLCDCSFEKVTIMPKYFSNFYGFRIYYLAIRIYAKNLVRLARCVAKIRLLLCLVDGKINHIFKRDKFVCLIRANNFPRLLVCIATCVNK